MSDRHLKPICLHCRAFSSSAQLDLVPGLSIDEATSPFLLPKVGEGDGAVDGSPGRPMNQGVVLLVGTGGRGGGRGW